MRPTQARALARRPELQGRVSTEGGSLVVHTPPVRTMVDRFRLRTRRRLARFAIALFPL